MINFLKKHLVELENKQTGIEYFETLMLYIINTAKNLSPADVNKVVNKVGIIYPEGSEVIMTIADIWKEEGKMEGKKEGKIEGIKKAKEAVAKNAIKEGMEFQLIEKLTGLTRQEIKEIARELEK